LPAKRQARVERETKETRVLVDLRLDGQANYDVSSTIPMLDHMLEQLARHGRMDLTVEATGDTDRDAHHLVEDVAIALGQALNE